MYDDNGMHLELGILMQPGKHVRGTKSMELLSQSFWPSFLKPAKLFESMAPKKQVQARWFSRFLGGWVLNPENGADVGFKMWSSTVVHSLPYSVVRDI